MGDEQDGMEPDQDYDGEQEPVGATSSSRASAVDEGIDDEMEAAADEEEENPLFSDTDEEEDEEQAKRDAETIHKLNKKRARPASPEEDDEDEDEDDDEDDDAVFNAKDRRSSKSKKSKAEPKKKRTKKKIDVSNFFLEEAEQGEDEDEEEEENRQAAEEVLEEDHQAAVDAVERRHKAARERLNMSADEQAEEYEQRHREQARRQKMQGQIYGGQEGGQVRIGGSAVMQQSLLPSINDAGIWKVKCAPGKEMLLVRSILLKAFESRQRGNQPINIKSAFCNATKGYIYVEALAEPYAREAITGLRGLYQSSFQRIAVQEMTTLLTVTVTKKPLKEGQWIRLKRGQLKGDLARVVAILEGGAKAMIQAVPRPDYSKTMEKSSSGSKAKPAQRMFDSEEARQMGLEVARRQHPSDRHGRVYDFFNNEFYRDGYLFKEVTVQTFIEVDNIRPRLEELRLFQLQAAKEHRNEDDPDNDEDDQEAKEQAIESQSLLRDIAAQLKDLGDEGSKSGITAYVRGDLVRVVSGELKNLVGKVLSVNEVSRTVTIEPMNSALTDETVVETDLLVKYVIAGAHVKVVNGTHMGQTGRVVSVNNVDGDHIAAILTDGMNTEIQCNVGNLQISSEVATGHGYLDGYELYDLVAVNENEYAVVVLVGSERLRVVNHSDLSKDLVPPELQGKKNVQSSRASAFDSQQTSIYPGDSVKVVSGVHAGKLGSIRHIMKGNLWLHSTTYLKNSGIFAVRARFCVVAGKKAGALVASTSFSTSASAASVGSKVAAVSGPNFKAARDSNVGNTVRITKGQYKGELAQIVDATGTHYNVELLSKMRKVMIEKEKTILVGDKAGTMDPEKRAMRQSAADMSHRMDIPDTPRLSAETPRGGGETPHHTGSETPLHGGETPDGGRRTPGYAADEGNNAWTVSASDAIPMGHHTSMGTGSHLMSGSVSGSTPFGYPTSMSYGSSSLSPGTHSSTTPATAYMSWDRDYVVVFKRGPNIGNYGVVMRKPGMDGQVRVANYDIHSQRVDENNSYDVSQNDLALAAVGKRGMIRLISGKNAGQTGVVSKIMDKDVLLEAVGGARAGELHKLSAVVWISNKLS